MTTTHNHGMELADYIHDLTRTHTVTQTITERRAGTWHTRRHQTRAPALIVQLWESDIPSETTEEGPRPEFASKPAARLEAFDTAARIDLEASRWVRMFGHHDPADQIESRTLTVIRGSGTVACILLLHGLHPSADSPTRRAIERDVRSWWTQARIVTGWDSPAWRPDSTCPMCGMRGSLRIRLADQIGMCTHDACRTTWDQATVGLLADHIRAESESQQERRPGVGPCWCPLPEPVVPDLRFRCPTCGSARCWHGVSARLVADTRGTVSARGA